MTDANPGHIELAGGWCIPKDQMPGWPFDRLLTPVRGGMKYPTPTKETHTMAENENTQDSAEMLEEMLEMRKRLDLQIAKMQKLIHKQRYPKVPSKADGDMYMIDVKFDPAGKTYRFLLLRTPNGWYTTGTGDTAHFETWTALVDWLRGPDVHWHGAMQKLLLSGGAVMEAERNR
jgi:hypothetical protein